jgi:hypothetical protein
VTTSKRRSAPPRTKGFLDALETSFTEALRTPEGTAEPVALLWTDADRQWVGRTSHQQTVTRASSTVASIGRAPRAANLSRTKERMQ